MKSQTLINNSSTTLQEWTNFLVVLNKAQDSNQPILKKADSPYRLVSRLAQQFAK